MIDRREMLSVDALKDGISAREEGTSLLISDGMWQYLVPEHESDSKGRYPPHIGLQTIIVARRRSLMRPFAGDSRLHLDMRQFMSQG
jgi:hypothetical protein